MLTLLDEARLISSERGHKIIDTVTGETFGPVPGTPGVDLSLKQYKLLLALARHPPRYVMPRSEVVAVLYNKDRGWNWKAYDQMIDALVKRLNVSLVRLGWPPSTVQSVRGRGLRLAVPPAYLLHMAHDTQTSDNIT